MFGIKKLITNFFSNPKSDFLAQGRLEEENLKEHNKHIIVEKGQIWRKPLYYADIYSEPLFLDIKGVENEDIHYTTNYGSEQINAMTMKQLKENFLLVTNEGFLNEQ